MINLRKTPIINYTLSIILILGITGCQQKTESKAANKPSTEKSSKKDLGQAGVKDEDSQANILDIAVSSEAHSTLASAIQQADIEHVLVNPGPLTVFAPVNKAFEKLPEGTVENLMKPENKAKLAKVLTRHAAPGNFDQQKLRKEAKKGRQLFMATNDYFEITTDGEKVMVNGVEILKSIEASNGVIHVVDEVLLPKE